MFEYKEERVETKKVGEDFAVKVTKILGEELRKLREHHEELKRKTRRDMILALIVFVLCMLGIVLLKIFVG